MTRSIRVLLADDHPVVRRGLLQVIATDRTIEVVAEASDGAEALASIEKENPDVAVLDINMPKADGFAVVRTLRKQKRTPEFVFLTMHTDPQFFKAAMDLGVKGYVLKDSAVSDIIAAIKSVAHGKPYLSPALSGQLLERRNSDEELGLGSLTAAEHRVLQLIARDLSSKEIGAELSISPRTVRNIAPTFAQN